MASLYGIDLAAGSTELAPMPEAAAHDQSPNVVSDKLTVLAAGRLRRLRDWFRQLHPAREENVMSIAVGGITFDARDARVPASFWAAALGRSVADGASEASAAVEADPAIPGSRISFRQVPEGKSVKNRVHLDLFTGDLEAEVRRLTGLGAATLRETNAGLHYVTLADPEGNEFDLIAR
jgi:hypothetical protein